MRELVRLTDAHRESLARFLDAHRDTTLFMRSNLAEAGFDDALHPRGGIWVGALARDRLVAVAVHFNAGNVVIEADDEAGPDLDAAARMAVAESRRPVRGVIGPWARATRCLPIVSPDAEPTECSREVLFALALDALNVPGPLASGELTCRRAADAEIDLLVAWRSLFFGETMPGAAASRRPAALRQAVVDAHHLGRLFVLEDAEGEVLATSAFNASADGIVQVGGVFTPPERRRRCLCRAVVAGSLLLARAQGARRSVLFTAESNTAAQRAYAALGYEVVGDYGLLLF